MSNPFFTELVSIFGACAGPGFLLGIAAALLLPPAALWGLGAVAVLLTGLAIYGFTR